MALDARPGSDDTAPEAPERSVNDDDGSAAVMEQFRRIYRAVSETARADRTMLGLWFTMLTGRPAAALLADRRLVDDYLPWVERRLVHRARRSGSSWAGLGRRRAQRPRCLVTAAPSRSPPGPQR